MSQLPDMPITPQEWLREQLDGTDLTNVDIGALTTRLAEEARVTDVPHWMRPGLQAAIRKELRAQGFVVNVARTLPNGRSPVAEVDQLEFLELVEWVKFKRAQEVHDRAAVVAVIVAWLATHPDVDRTVEEILDLAGYDAA